MSAPFGADSALELPMGVELHPGGDLDDEAINRIIVRLMRSSATCRSLAEFAPQVTRRAAISQRDNTFAKILHSWGHQSHSCGHSLSLSPSPGESDPRLQT